MKIGFNVFERQMLPQSPELTLPHPYMTERAFVLVPLAEIAPALAVKGKTVEAWRDATGSEGVTLVSEKR